MTACSSMKAWFTPGACQTPRDIRSQIASLYYTYAVDVLTDLMSTYSSSLIPRSTPTVPSLLLRNPNSNPVMALPIRLIWNLQMPRTQKLGIIGLFGIGLILTAVATLRVAQIGGKAQSSSQPSASWLALWGIIECSIAVIIGCCPAFVTLIRNHTTPSVSYNTQGFVRQREEGEGKDGNPDSVKLSSIVTTSNATKSTDVSTKSTSSKEAGWEDVDGSQFELVTRPRDRDVVEELEEETPTGRKKVRVRRGAR